MHDVMNLKQEALFARLCSGLFQPAKAVFTFPGHSEMGKY